MFKSVQKDENWSKTAEKCSKQFMSDSNPSKLAETPHFSLSILFNISHSKTLAISGCLFAGLCPNCHSNISILLSKSSKTPNQKVLLKCFAAFFNMWPTSKLWCSFSIKSNAVVESSVAHDVNCVPVNQETPACPSCQISRVSSMYSGSWVYRMVFLKCQI